ncbi:MAG: lysophospholipid acyltransferase family protein [Candidatus Methylomirabilales bacterium]
MLRVIQHLGAAVLCLWFATIRLRWSGGEYVRTSPRERRNAIFVFWHQRLLCFLYTHRGGGGHVLVSRSHDGEIVARLLVGLGFAPVRGSSRRGGAGALRELLEVVGDGRDIGITPDGPRGPAQVCKPGAVYLASRSGLPLVPLSVSYRRFWALRSWDRFQLPWPGTSAVVHAGDPIWVPANLDAQGVEDWRARVEAALVHVTAATDEDSRVSPRRHQRGSK